MLAKLIMCYLLSTSIFAAVTKDLRFNANLMERATYLPRNSTHSFVTASEDGHYALYFYGGLDWHIDTFFNTKGLIINRGTRAIPINQQNNVTRNWLYSVTPAFEAKIDDLHLFATPDFGQQQFRSFDILGDINLYRSLSMSAGFQKSLVSGIDVLVGSRFFGYSGFTTNMAPFREVALNLYGTLGPTRAHSYSPYHMYGFNDWFSYQLAITNGNADASFPGYIPYFASSGYSSYQSIAYNIGNKAFEGRAFFMPMIDHPDSLFQNFGLGFAGSAATMVNQIELPAYLSIGKNVIFQFGGDESNAIAQGTRNRLHPQWVWFKNQWGIVGDYVLSLQHLALDLRSHVLDTAQDIVTQNNQAFEIQYLYNLTGEILDMGLMKPDNKFIPFDKHHLGGFQLGFRYSFMNLDESVFQKKYMSSIGHIQYYYADPRVSVQKASAFSVLLNWYWNQNLMIGTEFSYTKFKGGCSTGAFKDPNTPGCQTASNFYVSSPGSEVIDRPAETVLLQRMAFVF